VSRRLYASIRALHLYFGLATGPLVLVFAVSVILLNHTGPWSRPGPDIPAGTRRVEIPAGDRVAQIRAVMRQVGVAGEIGHFRERNGRWNAVVWQPGRETSLEIDPQARTVALSRRDTGIGGAMIYLHKSPGPHLANLRGNWFYTRLWHVFADGLVYLVLFLAASGVYLWTVLRAERRLGLILLGAGTFTFLGLVYALAA